MFRIGVDVGGTNIAVGIVNDSYQIIKKMSVKTSEASTPSEMVAAIAGAVKELMESMGLENQDIEAIGVGVPGTAEPETGKVLYANNLGFEDVEFLTVLKTALGEDLSGKVYFDNDANAAAIGEYITGGYQADNFVMVTLGTGVGGGIIINGQVIRGCNYAAAEFGHMAINIDDCDCNCGRKGCFEDYASASALMGEAWEAMNTPAGKSSLLWEKADKKEELSGEIFFEAVRANDAIAQGVLNNYCYYLAEGLTNIINILQPEVLVLSGGITRAADLFLDKVKDKVAREVYSRTSKRNTEILVARGISDAGDVGIIGAALIDKM